MCKCAKCTECVVYEKQCSNVRNKKNHKKNWTEKYFWYRIHVQSFSCKQQSPKSGSVTKVRICACKLAWNFLFLKTWLKNSGKILSTKNKRQSVTIKLLLFVTYFLFYGYNKGKKIKNWPISYKFCALAHVKIRTFVTLSQNVKCFRILLTWKSMKWSF